jgi:phosphohistidine swiveling domain-containing protein
MSQKKLTTIWSHRPYPPYVMSMATEATVFGFRKMFPGSSIDYGINYYQNGQSTYLYPVKQYIDTANAIAKKATDRPDDLLRILKIAFRKSAALNRYSASFTPARIKAADPEELIRWIDHFSKLFLDMYVYGTVPILVGYSQDNILYKTAERILKKKTKGRAGTFADLYVILTNQPRLNRNVSLELETIRLAKRAVSDNIRKSESIKKHYRHEIKKLFDKYKWLSYNLCEVSWDEDYIANLVFEKIGQDLDGQYRNLMSYEKRTQKLFKESVRKLRLTKKEIGVFEAIRNLGYYKWAREYEFTEAFFRLDMVQNELAKRLRISPLAVKYLMSSEYSLLLDNLGKYKSELPKRVKRSLIVQDRQKGISIFVGPKAIREWDKIKPAEKEKDDGLGRAKGSPAYGGIVRGTVRIVNSVRHISKVSPGDILVAVTTNPALLPAMKKAAAIVTNEGGITSHAAIVSRELQIPCIVGAKNATRIFKNGQTVEVDAKHGIVRRMK